MKEYLKWRHVAKLDPDKRISEKQVNQLVEAGTDAIMVSGTLDITRKKILNLRSKIKCEVPVVLEPCSPEVVFYDLFDYVFVPSVLNGKKDWLIGRHVEWAKNEIQWDKIVPVAYLVLNPDSAVAKVTGAKTDLSIEDIVSYGKIAEKYFKFPILYYEESGRFGKPEILKALSHNLRKIRLYYGGGIDSQDKAKEMLCAGADTIVVGNMYHSNFEKALETIV